MFFVVRSNDSFNLPIGINKVYCYCYIAYDVVLCFHTMYSTHWPPWPVFCAVLIDNLLLNDLFPLCLETKPD